MRAPWVLVALVLAGAPASAGSQPVQPPPGLAVAAEAARDLPRLHSLLVSWRGELVLERYFNGARAARPANVKSVSKSVISALVGIAIDRGLIEDVSRPIAEFFPGLLDGPANAAKRRITVEDLLTMRAGLASTSSRNYGAWVQSGNWVRYALSRPLEGEPGEVMDYSTGNTHLLSAILTKVSGTSTWAFAQEALAAPLGFRLERWMRDPQGIYFGGNQMAMTPRSLVAFGELYRNGGKAPDGTQLVSPEWIERSWQPRTQAWVELVLYFVFFFPGVLALAFAGWKYASRSWSYGEVSVNSPAGVPIYQFKTVIVAAGLLLAIQGIAQVCRCILAMREGYWRLPAEDVEETEQLALKQPSVSIPGTAKEHTDMK